MNDIQIFNNPDFGEIRTVIIDGEPWFVGRDLAHSLGYAKPETAIRNNVDKDDTLTEGVMDAMGRKQGTLVVNESGLYSLIFASKLPTAQKFKRWVTKDVLPSLRRTGTYSTQKQLPMSTEQKIQLLAQGYTEVNERLTEFEGRIDAVENELPLLPVDADRISNAARARGVEIMGGKNSTAYKSKSIRQNVYSSIYGNLKYQFGITGTYKKLRRNQCDKAIEIIQNYQPPMYLKEMIDRENSQR